MLDYLRALLTVHIKSERGSSAVEYAMICAGVAVIISVSFGFREVLRIILEEEVSDVSVKVP